MRRIILVFLISYAAFASGCGSNYGILKESKATSNLNQYGVINVGWLDLNEEKWKQFGYDNKDKWLTTINFMNQKYMPDYFKKILLQKKVTVVASKNDQPDKQGLVIKFSEVEYVQRTSTAAKVMWGRMAGSDVLNVTIHFIDGKTAEELYQVRASLYSKAKMDQSGWGFEGRVNNCVYNLVVFISEKLK